MGIERRDRAASFLTPLLWTSKEVEKGKEGSLRRESHETCEIELLINRNRECISIDRVDLWMHLSTLR